MSANRVLVLAESGGGKSSSIEHLDPRETFIINIASKDLPFRGARSKFIEWDGNAKTGNLLSKSDPATIFACMDYINKKKPEIKNLIIDDLFYMAAFQLFDRVAEKGYDKFNDIAVSLKEIATRPQHYRDDLFVFYLTHPDESTDIDGNRIIKTKLSGRMVDQQLNFEGLFSIVFYARPHKGKDKTLEYGFETRTDGSTPTKTPVGMFELDYIPNNLQYVKEEIIKYQA